MSDNLEIIVENIDYEIHFDDGTEILFTDDGLEVNIESDLEVVITDDQVEILTDSEPGIPSGGTLGQVLAKKSSTSFDVEWVSQVKITVGKIPPSSPAVGDLWVDTN